MMNITWVAFCSQSGRLANAAKIYRTSKARWCHYEKHLGPLLSLLN
jgi:hypothetical protein